MLNHHCPFVNQLISVLFKKGGWKYFGITCGQQVLHGERHLFQNQTVYSWNVQEWKSTLLGSHIRDHFILKWKFTLQISGIHSLKSVIQTCTSLEWIQPLKKMVPNMTPKRVDATHLLSMKRVSSLDFSFFLNTLQTSPEYTRAGVYGKCVLKQKHLSSSKG